MIVRYHDKQWHFEGSMTVEEVLRRIGLDPRNLLVIRRGEILRQDVVLAEDDTIECVEIIAGG